MNGGCSLYHPSPAISLSRWNTRAKPKEEPEFAALIAQMDKEIAGYREAVIVLEEGTEPMVGDFVSIYSSINRPARISKSGDIVTEGICYGNISTDPDVVNKIIQRDGKPVIYKQALQSNKREG